MDDFQVPLCITFSFSVLISFARRSLVEIEMNVNDPCSFLVLLKQLQERSKKFRSEFLRPFSQLLCGVNNY